MYGDRLRKLREELHLKQGEMATTLDITQSSLSQYELEQRSLPIDLAEKIAIKYEISPDWLLTGRGEMYYNNITKGENVAAVVKANMAENQLVYIDLLDAKVSAGSGIDCLDAAVIDKVPMPHHLIYPYNPDKVKIVQVSGDSMTPRIYNGDYVLYVPGFISENGIYIIDVFGELRCKRLEFKVSGDVIVISENERYEKELFKKGDETLRICGKVIAWAHKHNY